MKCSYRTFLIDKNHRVWRVTQDIRRRKKPHTGARYMGVLTDRQIRRYCKQMDIAFIVRLKSWKAPKRAEVWE